MGHHHRSLGSCCSKDIGPTECTTAHETYQNDVNQHANVYPNRFGLYFDFLFLSGRGEWGGEMTSMGNKKENKRKTLTRKGEASSNAKEIKNYTFF